MTDVNDFDIVATTDGDVGRVTISGELDTDTAPRLISTTHEIAVAPRRGVELDCEGVTFLDSAGVRALIVARNEATRNGVDLVLVRPSAQLTRVIEMTGLVDFLSVAN